MLAWAALIAFALSGSQQVAGQPERLLTILPLGLGLSAWLVDGFYLWQERRFRSLYDFARVEDTTKFSMELRPMNGRDTPHRSMFSWSLLLFYLLLGTLHVVVAAV